jgi:hypothetical protein
MVRGEGERRFDRRLHVYATCSHPIPVETAVQPSPLSSPSNEQAHHMSLGSSCRYDCEQSGSAINFSSHLKTNHEESKKIEDRRSRIDNRFARDAAILYLLFSIFVVCFGTRVPLRTSGGRYIQAEPNCRRAKIRT